MRKVEKHSLNDPFGWHMQVYATIKTGSMAIAASTLDSLLDFLAGGILYFTHLTMKSVNIYKYPIGKLRVQPVGIIVFAAIMATLGVRSTSIRRLILVNCNLHARSLEL